MTAQRRADREPTWVVVVDAVLDGSVLSFALWTLMYTAAMILHWSAWATGEVWLPLALLVVGTCVTREVLPLTRNTPSPEPEIAGPRLPRLRWWHELRYLLLGGGVLLAAFAAALAYRAPVMDFRRLWEAGMVGSLLIGAFAVTRGRFEEPGHQGRALGSRTHLMAAATTLGLGVFTMFVRNPNSDDIYYVNRSVWVAQRGTFPTRDTIFSAAHFHSTYGFPVASVEGLLGSLAHLFGYGGATFTYLVAAPVFVVLAAWALWRLTAAWAPRRALLVFMVAILVYLWCAAGTIGDFAYARMWQGKVLGICLVVPLAWLYLTRLARASRTGDKAWTMFLLLGLGVAFVGLSTTGIIMAPVMACAMVLAVPFLWRGWGRLLSGTVLFALGPVVAGLGVLLFTSQVAQVWQRTKPPAKAFDRVVGPDPWLVALLVLGLLVGPALVRNREGRAFAAAATFVVFAVLTHGLFGLMNAYTGAGPIDYRLLLITPIPLLVGLLVAVPLPEILPRLVRWPVVAALAAGLILVTTANGTPVWSKEVGAALTTRPTWKTHLVALHDTRRVVAMRPGPGPVLLPKGGMALMALLTTRVHAVAPRRFYLHGLPEEAGNVIPRKVLIRVVSPTAKGLPPLPRVERALADLNVSLACDYATHVTALAELERAGYRSPQRVGSLICLSPPPKAG